MGADLKTTSIMMRECFHLVNLFNTLNKLMHENMLRHEYVAVAPMTKLSAVNSGGSPKIQAGKSLIGMLLIRLILFNLDCRGC